METLSSVSALARSGSKGMCRDVDSSDDQIKSLKEEGRQWCYYPCMQLHVVRSTTQ